MQYDESVLKRIFSRFRVTGNYSKGAPYGSGHINDTYKIVTAESGAPDYILQRINHHVFKDVAGLQQTMTPGRATGGVICLFRGTGVMTAPGMPGMPTKPVKFWASLNCGFPIWIPDC